MSQSPTSSPSIRTTTLLAALAGVPSLALAQQPVSATDAFAWSENAGWLNWRDAGNPAGSQAARLHPSFLSGFVWGENIGWINLGDGTPANGTSYANTTGADFGVNRDPATGNLTGLAWGENIGWINFSWAALNNAQRPRIESNRLRGFAWAENIGWINLDLPTPGQFVAFVPTGCGLADIVGIGGEPPADGLLTGDDFIAFINAFAAGDALADVVGIGGTPPSDGLITGDDFVAYINAFAAGCP